MSSDFCFEKSRELLSKPFSSIDIPENYSTKNFDKKTRDLIGENLLEIENTLKALNLDFLQTYNELEKTDSAETLFGETYNNYESSPKIQNSKLTKLFDLNYVGGGGNTGNVVSTGGGNNNENHSKLIKKLSNEFFIDIPRKQHVDSTPESNFSPKETSISSRRSSSQKSNYSPQDTNFSPRDLNFQSIQTHERNLINFKSDYIHDMPAQQHQRNKSSSSPVRNIVTTSNNSIHSSIVPIYGTSAAARRTNDEQSPSNRQRSMSFTENYDLKSPVLSEPPIVSSSATKLKYDNHIENDIMPFNKTTTRNVIMYKPKSIRARNLRRLSYNPIILDSSSSTSSETEFDRSIAHSECDIRTKMITSRRKRPYRKSNQSQDKIYGSNASIKSAPQYNYISDRQTLQQQHKYLEQQPPPPSIHASYEYPEKIYETPNRIIVVNKTANTFLGNKKFLPPNYQSQNPLVGFDRELLYSEFDVTKLTGKSPTTHNYLTQFHPATLKQQTTQQQGQLQPTQPQPQTPRSAIEPGQGFRWPEKIHASAIKQNDLLWRRGGSGGLPQRKYGSQQAIYSDMKYKENFSSDSSSTETDSINFRRSFIPRMPPSPAP